MANLTDPGKKKKIRIKVGKAADKSGDGAEIHFSRGKEHRTYKEADVRTGHPDYGKESKSKTTPTFIKRAQEAKQDIVHKDGRPYRAGHKETVKEPDKFRVKIKVTPDIRPVEQIEHKSAEELRQKSGPVSKRRLERVEWLKGRNKRTESGFGK